MSRPSIPGPGPAVALLAVALLAGPLVALGASWRRGELEARRAPVAAAARLLPWPDLAVASGARHLRFLSLEEPAAAFADGPASLDTDPAGGSLAPPVDVWTAAASGR